MAPPRDTPYAWSFALVIAILVGLTLGRLTLNARWCSILSWFNIHVSGCADLKPGALGNSTQFCKPLAESTDAFITVKNVGYGDAAASRTEVMMYYSNVSSQTFVATPAIPAGGSFTAQVPAPLNTIDFPIRVTVDVDQTVSEFDENNNVMFGTCKR